MLYFFAYALGCASVGALWVFWPKVKAEIATIEADVKAKIEAQVAKL